MARPRFTVRTLLLVMLLIAMLLGWYLSVQDAKKDQRLRSYRLRYAQTELVRTRDQLKDRVRPPKPLERTLSDAKLDGSNLRDVTIGSSSNAFQRASIKNCDLRNATLQAGGSSFQHARFDGSNLANAKLTGGASSFQFATFVTCDLTGALLTGVGTSFQCSSFENATLVGARLTGSFQGSNISGAHFEGADLSALDSRSLESCYFKLPPTYDGTTQFPAGFDPEANLWRRTSEAE